MRGVFREPATAPLHVRRRAHLQWEDVSGACSSGTYEREICVKQFEVNDSEIERIEDSLALLRKGFAQYCEQFEKAYESVQMLLADRARGFPN